MLLGVSSGLPSCSLLQRGTGSTGKPSGGGVMPGRGGDTGDDIWGGQLTALIAGIRLSSLSPSSFVIAVTCSACSGFCHKPAVLLQAFRVAGTRICPFRLCSHVLVFFLLLPPSLSLVALFFWPVCLFALISLSSACRMCCLFCLLPACRRARSVAPSFA